MQELPQKENSNRTHEERDQKLTNQFVIDIKVAKWFNVYCFLLVSFCRLHGTQPDVAKLERVMSKAIKVTHARPKKNKGSVMVLDA